MISGFRVKQTARTTLRLLEQERRALLSGNLAALPAIGEKLARCAEALEGPLSGADRELGRLVELIRSAAQHNQELADAARRGLKSAARLHAESMSGASRLQTYTHRGRTQVIDNAARRGSDRRT